MTGNSYGSPPSSSTVNNICRLIEEHTGNNAVDLLAACRIACIGPLTAETALNRGLKVDCVAEEATINSMVHAIVQL